MRPRALWRRRPRVSSIRPVSSWEWPSSVWVTEALWKRWQYVTFSHSPTQHHKHYFELLYGLLIDFFNVCSLNSIMMSCCDCVEVANGSSPNSERREPSDLHYNEEDIGPVYGCGCNPSWRHFVMFTWQHTAIYWSFWYTDNTG